MNFDQAHTLAFAFGITAFLIDWFFFRRRATNTIQEKDKLDSTIYNYRVIRNLIHSTFIALLVALAALLMHKAGIFSKFKLHFTFDKGTELIITIIALMFTVFVFVITHTFKQMINEANRILATAEKQEQKFTEFSKEHEKKFIEFYNEQESRILQSFAFQECATEYMRRLAEYAQGNEEAHLEFYKFAQFLELLKINFKDEIQIKKKLKEISKNKYAISEISQLPQLKQFLEKLMVNNRFPDETKGLLCKLIH